MLKKLKKYKNSHFPILSVYLADEGKKSPTTRALSSLFRSLIHKNLTAKEQRMFHDDLQKIETYLEDSLDTRGNRSFVFFTAGDGLWEVLSFEFYLPPIFSISGSPFIDPIEETIKEHKKYLVLMVDRQKARLFTVNLGRIEEHKDVFEGEVPQRVKAKKVDYGRDDKIFRHIEEHLHQHLNFIAQAVNDFAKKDGINFIIIGGHEEIIPKMIKHLSPSLKKMVLGKFIAELNIPLNDIFLESKRVASRLTKP
ncbi:MAG: hypothetical protein M1150_03160 [Patescibacteria group bacterium]|nr:hypothetical protein [Patescibacteria group bacterium]